jgi:tetratricopeptide (TPR) repeat protein
MKNVFVPEVTRLARARRVEDAVAIARQNVESNPGDAAAHSALAHALIFINDLAEADAAASAAVALAEGEPAYHFLLARIKFARAHFDLALSHALRAYVLCEQLGSAYYLESAALIAAAAFAELGDLGNASQALEAVGESSAVLAGRHLTKESVRAVVAAKQGRSGPSM